MNSHLKNRARIQYTVIRLRVLKVQSQTIPNTWIYRYIDKFRHEKET